MRTTHALVQVAMAMMAVPEARHWGYSLGKDSGVRSGVLYPILRRMLDDGWVDDGWESAEEAHKRPPRRYYVLTDKGREELGRLLQATRNDPRFQVLGFAL
ncbi:PadR family transcriptional regulator [Amycolatopsis sp. NPDC004772]